MDYNSPHLEPKTYKNRAPFLAPKGTTLLSRGKPVTSSDPNPAVGKLAMLTDGGKGNHPDDLVELKPGIQWVQVDLGASAAIEVIVVWHYYTTDRVYFDIVAQVSDDPEFKKDVHTVYNNDFDNSSKLGVGDDNEYIENFEGRLINAKGATGRYVRLYSNGNTTDRHNHYTEVEVFGKITKP